jgi:hypothetical protein
MFKPNQEVEFISTYHSLDLGRLIHIGEKFIVRGAHMALDSIELRSFDNTLFFIVTHPQRYLRIVPNNLFSTLLRSHLHRFKGNTPGGNYWEGLIVVEDNRVFLCQNVVNGSKCKNNYGYKYSYEVFESTTSDLKNFNILSKISFDNEEIRSIDLSQDSIDRPILKNIKQQ